MTYDKHWVEKIHVKSHKNTIIDRHLGGFIYMTIFWFVSVWTLSKNTPGNFVCYNFKKKVVEFTLSQSGIHPKRTNFITCTHNCMRQHFRVGWSFLIAEHSYPRTIGWRCTLFKLLILGVGSGEFPNFLLLIIKQTKKRVWEWNCCNFCFLSKVHL